MDQCTQNGNGFIIVHKLDEEAFFAIDKMYLTNVLDKKHSGVISLKLQATRKNMLKTRSSSRGLKLTFLCICLNETPAHNIHSTFIADLNPKPRVDQGRHLARKSRLVRSHSNASFPSDEPPHLPGRDRSLFVLRPLVFLLSLPRLVAFSCVQGNRLQGKMVNRVGITGVAVFWNVDSCPIPENINPSSIRQRIGATLNQCGYCGTLTIHAYRKVKDRSEEAPRIAGIDVINVGQGRETVEMSMLVDISILASGIHCPAFYMLISEDLDFAYVVGMLKERRYSFLLCQRNPRASKFFRAARHAWRWPKLLLDGKPLRMHEACTSLAGPFILVIWDFENCCIPRTVNPSSISWKIRAYLDYHGYFGRVIIRAYGNTYLLSSGNLEALSKEIHVIHVDPGKNAADKRIVVDLAFLARDNMSAGVFMLISGDRDFIHVVRLLVQSGLTFLHCNPKGGASAFRPLADRVSNWPEIVMPSQPLLMNAASASHPSDNSISNVIPCQSSTRQQTVVPNKLSVQDIVLITLVISALLLVGACKHLPPNSYRTYGEAALVLGTVDIHAR